MGRHKSLNRQPRQQPVRPRQESSSLYHTPPQLPARRNPIVAHSVLTSEEDNGSRPPLCVATKKLLLQDIEENGGLHVFSLSYLRAARPQTYDATEYRLKQVQNYIYQLKQLNDTKYLLQLSHFGVFAASRLSQFFAPDEPTIPTPSPLSQTPTTPPRFHDIPLSPPVPTFTSPSRYHRTTANTMSSSSSNALTIRSTATHHDEYEGLLLCSLCAGVLGMSCFLILVSRFIRPDHYEFDLPGTQP